MRSAAVYESGGVEGRSCASGGSIWGAGRRRVWHGLPHIRHWRRLTGAVDEVGELAGGMAGKV